ncbi:tRNA dihydrouridine synthase [Stratiformator vulcanicus]|uniref:tRNA-dihydrouridine synthase n=1 Tax=Stratiformator vulcanicus TaxID=2527980 RepID=A0A517R4E3_9PLAN|nr:tRNA-dihydrouridine synthase [Stratiformator vulcanicus]QDT38747.1 tRNA-dihydrouridine synthase C [Stratiformator vulcanicus]
MSADLATPPRPGLRIGDRELATRYFLAPLAGYTHLAFRTAIRELGGLGLATTDLIPAKHVIRGSRKSDQLLETSPEDRPLTVQIFGRDAAEAAQAAQVLEDDGYGGVDLNMGCPMRKINKSGGGAKLMCEADSAVNMARTVIAAVSIPVTIKMRLGWDADSITAPQLARMFEQEGVAAVTVHGRTRAQGFSGSVDLNGIAATAAAVDSMPIIGNGDVRTPEDALYMQQFTGCDAIAIGRGAMMDPWIFRKLDDIAAGREPHEPEPAEIIAFLRRHFTLMTEQHGDYSCTLFRKFAAWYGAKLGVPEDLEDRLRLIGSVETFNEIVDEIEQRHGERESSIPTALVKVPNGPVERW